MNPNRDRDLALLGKLLDVHDEALSEDLFVKFDDMRKGIQGGVYAAMTVKQLAFAQETLEHIEPMYQNLVSAGQVPRGAEVKSMVGPLPKRPPQRRPADG